MFAVALALESVISISILERLTNVEGNLLKQQHKQIQRRNIVDVCELL